MNGAKIGSVACQNRKYFSKVFGLEVYTIESGKVASRIAIQQIEPFTGLSLKRLSSNIATDFEFSAYIFKPFFKNQRFSSEVAI
jgi:hypothetical protein